MISRDRLVHECACADIKSVTRKVSAPKNDGW